MLYCNKLFYADASTFSEDLNDQFRYTFGLLIGLNETILVGGKRELVKIAKKCVVSVL